MDNARSKNHPLVELLIACVQTAAVTSDAGETLFNLKASEVKNIEITCVKASQNINQLAYCYKKR